jgi:hypothetical protein
VRPASILLALVVVLGFVSEVRANMYEEYVINHDYTITIGSVQMGFIDGVTIDRRYRPDKRMYWSRAGIGKSFYDVPFTATQGLIGFCLILATLIIVPVVLTVRWRRRATV